MFGVGVVGVDVVDVRVPRRWWFIVSVLVLVV